MVKLEGIASPKMIGHFTNVILLVFIFVVESIDGTGPGVSVSVSPGQNLWVGEDLILECRSGIGRDGQVIWHRLVHSQESQDMGEDQDEEVAELLSHGDTLLLQDQRFSLLETQFEDSSVYRLKIEGVRVSDSGKYECQVADMDLEKDQSQHIQIDIYNNNNVNNSNNNNVKQTKKSLSDKKYNGQDKKTKKMKSDFEKDVDYNIDTEYLGDSIFEEDDSDYDHHQVIKQQSLINTKSEASLDNNKRQSKQQREVTNSAVYTKLSIVLCSFICLAQIIK